MNDSEQRFVFTGRGGELFRILLINALLTSVTLGVYAFWGYARTRRYFLRHTELLGAGFEYHATGRELFLLALYAALAVVGVGLVVGGLAYLSMLLETLWLMILPAFLSLAGLLVVLPWTFVAWRRFQLRRTGYRGLRFDFAGTPGEILRLALGGGLLCVLTFGIYTPWFQTRWLRYTRGRTRYGDESFAYDGQGGQLFGIWLGGYLLTLITAGIYGPWWTARLTRFHWSHTGFQGRRFVSDIRGGRIFGQVLLALLFTLLSLGIALPWQIVRLRRLFTDSVALDGPVDFARIGPPPASTARPESPRATELRREVPATPVPQGDFAAGEGSPRSTEALPSLPPQPDRPADWL